MCPLQKYRSPAGFTLLELLVVIGIATVVITILLGAIARVRQSAAGAVCASNLRQWGQATILYASADDYKFLPRRGQGVGVTSIINRPTDWFNALPPLMQMPAYVNLAGGGQIVRPGGAGSVWLCPLASDMAGPYYWSYAMNMGLSVWEANENNGNPDSLTGVGDISIMVLFTDAPGNYCSVFPSMYAGGYNPVPRHLNNTVNICFLDGHVAAIPGSYIGIGTGLITQPDVRWHPPGSTWNSAQ